MKTANEFPKRLKEIRMGRHISQENVAKSTGLARITISYYETGRRSPGLNEYVKIINFFNVSSDYFLGVND